MRHAEPEVKLQLMINAIETLLAAGYVYIGMDHFSKPDDDLAVPSGRGGCTAISRVTRPTAIAT